MSFYFKTKNKTKILLQLLMKNLTVSFAFAIMKNTVVCWARFPVKLFFGFAFRFAFEVTSACC